MLNEKQYNYEEKCDCKEMSSSELDEVAGGRGNGGGVYAQRSKVYSNQKHFALSKLFQKLFAGSKYADAQKQKSSKC